MKKLCIKKFRQLKSPYIILKSENWDCVRRDGLAQTGIGKITWHQCEFQTVFSLYLVLFCSTLFGNWYPEYIPMIFDFFSYIYSFFSKILRQVYIEFNKFCITKTNFVALMSIITKIIIVAHFNLFPFISLLKGNGIPWWVVSISKNS